MISPSTIDRIKEIPVLDVVRHFVDLKKAGQSAWRGLSPWANEKTPSFYVVPAKNIFKDFSTGKGGSAIHFVMEKEQLTFPEAIKKIAELCNERVEYDEKPTKEREEEIAWEEKLYLVNQAAARKYQEQLTTHLVIRGGDDEPDFDRADNPVFQELVTKRQYTPETIVQWQIGFAPPLMSPSGDHRGETPGNQQPATGNRQPWDFLTNLIGAKSRAEAMELGLIRESERGHTYDYFRNRIMFPIHNHHGRIVGFGGRWLGEKDPHNPKYLNSTESKIYHKETVLFGLHLADEAIRQSGYAYLMEGYTDVISFHQAGYNVAVATCGTALTESQCKLLKRYCNKVVLFRDGDKAGIDATLRDIDLLYAAGFEVAVVPMPDPEGVAPLSSGEGPGVRPKIDPDDLVRMFNKKQPDLGGRTGMMQVAEIVKEKAKAAKPAAKKKATKKKK